MSTLYTLLGRLLGTPSHHEEEKADPSKATVHAPEFDLTQYAKKLAAVVGVLFPAVLAALKAANVDLSDGILIAALAVTGAALIGVCLVMAADLGARAYADRSSRWSAQPASPPAGALGRTPLMTVWMRGETEALPVLAVDRDSAGTAYLVLRGSTSKKTVDGHEVEAYDDGPEWVSASEVTACSV